MSANIETPIITEAMEEIIQGEIRDRDQNREVIYKEKYEELKDNMYRTLDSHMDRLVKEAIGENGLADLAVYRKYKPMIESIIKILQLNGMPVGDDTAPELKVNEFGFPTNTYGEPSVVKNSTKNPGGFSVSDEYKGSIEDSESLYNKVGELNQQLTDLSQEYRKMLAKNFLLESLAGMSKDIISEATAHFKDVPVEDLEAENAKVIKEWLAGKSSDPTKYKGLMIEGNKSADADESTESQIVKAKEYLTESSMPYGKAAESRINGAKPIARPETNFVVPGLQKKTVEVVPMGEMANKLDPQIERALSDLSMSNGGWRKRAEAPKDGK